MSVFIDEEMRRLAAWDAEVGDPAPVPAEALAAETLTPPDCPALRVIRPEGPVRGVCLYFHPGGFVMGEAAMGDARAVELARDLGVASVGVEYRLAPAHVWPAALEDGVAAARWLIANAASDFGTGALLVSGVSAGAMLAVQMLLALGRDAARFRAADLVAGNYDLSGTPSQKAATEAQFLSPARLAETRDNAFPGLEGGALRAPSISALYADLSGLPPAILTVGALDSVRDDSLLLAARLEAAGVRCALTLAPEADHVFLAQNSHVARAARGRITAFLGECLAA